MYYKLDSEFPLTDCGSYFDIHDGLSFEGVRSWACGEVLPDTLPCPIVIEIEKVGDPDDDAAVRPIAFNDANMCIATPAIVDALRACGLENLQFYPAVLRDSGSGTEWPYFAINILGCVAAADLKKSDWINLDGAARGDSVFMDLVLDQDKLPGLEMFRLAEDTGTIIVSERVKQALAHCDDLQFFPVTAR